MNPTDSRAAVTRRCSARQYFVQVQHLCDVSGSDSLRLVGKRVTPGAEAIYAAACEEAFPGQETTFVLDLFHALGCADAAVKAAAPDERERKDWKKTIKDQPDAGRVDDVIADLEPYRRLEAVAACIRTYETNKDRMSYDLRRERGLLFGVGGVESVFKQIVGSRFKGAGRRWSKAGANAVLAIKCCFRNNRWPDFLDWRACSAAAA